MSENKATLVADPYQGFSVVFTDSWGAIVHRTPPGQTLEEALLSAAQWLGRPLTLELRQLA